jgi:hypothetical protein
MGSERIILQKHEVSLKEIITSLKIWCSYIASKIRLITLMSILFSLLGLLISFIYKPKYIAKTSFVLEGNKKSSLGEYASIAARFGFSSGGGSGLFQDDYNMMTFLHSKTMMLKTLYSKSNFDGKDELIANRFYNAYKFNYEWRNDLRLSNIVFHEMQKERNLLEDSVALLFCKIIDAMNLNVYKPDKEESVIEVSTSTIDGPLSKAFNEILISNAIQFYYNMQTKRMTENVNILQHQVDSVRGLLNIALTGMAASSDENPNVNPAYQRLKVPSQKRMVDVEMNKSILEELVKNLEISKITLRKESPIIQVIDSPTLPLEKYRITKTVGILVGLFSGIICTIIFYTIAYFYNKLMQ